MDKDISLPQKYHFDFVFRTTDADLSQDLWEFLETTVKSCGGTLTGGFAIVSEPETEAEDGKQ